MRTSLIAACLVLTFTYVLPLYCHVGYGQRGKLQDMGIGWDRECPGIRYCFEVVTTEIDKVKKLIDFPWVRYFSSKALMRLFC